MATVGDRIRARRLELGLAQRALAGPGVSYSYIALIEANERTPSTKTLRKLAPKLDVSPYWLEAGKPDLAELLAELVLEYDGQPLPAQATTLARSIVRDKR